MDKQNTVAAEGNIGSFDGHSPVKEMKREIDSLDDFEHLGHEISPAKKSPPEVLTGDLLGNFKTELTRDVTDVIDKGADSAAQAAHKITDELSTTLSAPLAASLDSVKTGEPDHTFKMDSNLLEMGDSFPDRKEADDKLDKFLSDMQYSSTKKDDIPEKFNKDLSAGEFRTATQDFMDAERQFIEPKKTELLDRYSDSEDDDFKASKYSDLTKKPELPTTVTPDDKFKNVIEAEPPTPPKRSPVEKKAPVDFSAFESVKEKTPEVIKKPIVEPPKPPKPAPAEIKAASDKKVSPPAGKSVVTKPETQIIDAEAFFCKMGLDTWFHPEKLNPKVEGLIYWRDPKKSGPVFGGVLVVLLALTYFSLISVVAYLSLLVLTGTISFRIYKNIVQAIQKTGDGHPFKEYLEHDLSLSPEKIKELSEVVVAHINAGVSELRRLFLVEDLVDSIKFGVLLWTLTYLGAWFNGMTLIILGWVALFTLPKVYETNKTQIDANLEIVRTKLAEITSKVKAAIPIGKKPEEKKEQ